MCALHQESVSHTHLAIWETQFMRGGILCSQLHARFHVRKYKEHLTLSSHQTETLSGGGGATLFHPAAQHNGAIAAGARDFASFRECIKFCACIKREVH
jgi:hypothetical protein